MNTARRGLLVAFVAILSVAGGAFAQQVTGTPTAPPSVTVGRSYNVSLPNDQPLVVSVAQTTSTPDGDVARVYVFVKSADGRWLPLSPCDNAIVPCDAVTMAIPGARPGDQYYLESATP